jgi:hypothetical protein
MLCVSADGVELTIANCKRLMRTLHQYVQREHLESQQYTATIACTHCWLLTPLVFPFLICYGVTYTGWPPHHLIINKSISCSIVL